jgi:hypothetical protein
MINQAAKRIVFDIFLGLVVAMDKEIREVVVLYIINAITKLAFGS